MKIFTLFCFLSLFIFSYSQNDIYFDLARNPCNMDGESLNFKIYLKNKSLSKCVYNVDFFSDIDESTKIAMAIELLRFRDELTLCSIEITCYSPLVSYVYSGERTRYTTQLEALFIINMILRKNVFIYSTYPLLYNIFEDQILYGDENEMDEIFLLYQNYLYLLQSGIIKYNNETFDPLLGSNYRWF